MRPIWITWRQEDDQLMVLAGKQLVFVTNNSTKSRADYKKKFDKMGITAQEVSSITLAIAETS